MWSLIGRRGLLCAFAFFVLQVHAQVLTKSGAGLSTPEAIQITGTAQNFLPPFYTLSFLSAQDTDGDGKTDLLAGIPTVQNGLPVSTTLLHNQGDQNFELSAVSRSSSCPPYYSYPPTANSVPPFCILADVNGDGMPDRIFASETPNSSNPAEVDNPVIGVAHATAPGSYAATIYYNVGGSSSYVSWVATGDFNGDGLSDIAALVMPQNPTPGTGLRYAAIVLLIADGHGGYKVSAPVNSGVFGLGGTTSVYPEAAVLDLNGDGKSDIIVFNGSGDSFIGVFLGTSTGLSQQPQITQFIDATFQIYVATDLNHDGYGDAVVLEDDGVHIMLGGPGGTYLGYFASDQVIPATSFTAQATAISAADFNGDHLLDLAVATPNDVTIYQQQASGTFSRLQQYPSGGLLTVGDFDGDGNPDLALGGNLVNILYGQGNGYFHGPGVTSNVYPNASAVATADFNRDGLSDIVSTYLGQCVGAGCTKRSTCAEPGSTCTNTNVSVFHGSGQGWFSQPMSYHVPLYCDIIGGVVVAAGDLNGDGIADIVAVNTQNEGQYDTAVLLGKADGTFAPAKGYLLGSRADQNLILIDMDHDGKLDLVGNSGIAYGKGDGSFQPVVGPNVFAVGDFNLDGRLDVLTSSGDNAIVELGGPGRTFTTSQTLSLPCASSCTGEVAIAAGDLNNDGKVDFVVLTTGALYTYLGNGNGTFHESTAAAVPTLYPSPLPYLSVSVQDMNGDGKNDVIVSPALGIMPIYLGRGDGTVAAPLVFPLNSYEISGPPAFGYFDQGHALDIVVPASSGFARLLNSGDETWPALSSLPKAPTP